MKKNLLLVEHGGDSKNFIFDVLARKEVHLFLVTTKAPDWVRAYVAPEKIIVVDTYDTKALIEAVQMFADSTQVKFDGVGTFYEHVVVQTAELAEALGCINIKPHAARQSSANKLAMRQACVASEIPTPRFTLVEAPTKESLQKAILEFGTPCVIKPVFGSQSYGVKKIESDDFALEDLDEVFQATDPSKKEVFKNFTHNFLIEEYMSGPVVSVDGFIQGGVVHIAGMVEFHMGPEPNFTQEANTISSSVEPEVKEACFAFAKNILQALEFDNCGFHCEMRITPQGPRLIEIACRLPGGPLQLGYKRAYGFEPASSLVDVWLGIPAQLTKLHDRHVLQKAVFLRERGIISEIQGMEEAQSVEGVWDFVPLCAVGESVVTYPDIPKPFYYYAAEADSKEELDTLSKKIEQGIRISFS